MTPQQIVTAAQALTWLTFPILTLQQASAWLSERKEGFGVHSCADATERSMRAAYLRQVESRPGH